MSVRLAHDSAGTVFAMSAERQDRYDECRARPLHERSHRYPSVHAALRAAFERIAGAVPVAVKEPPRRVPLRSETAEKVVEA
jgi:hypothetical protein